MLGVEIGIEMLNVGATALMLGVEIGIEVLNVS